uniref:Glypican-3 n=1 Tax=Seriola dumerili TaxID=41447 RepID=A0A3B4UFY6_SERDU
MVGSSAHNALFLCAFLQLFPLPGGQVPNCQEVRTVFQSLHPGSKWVPETPVSEAFDLVLRHGRNSTLAMLKSEFPSLAGGAQSLVGQLFLDMSLYILGSDSTVDHMVAVLYGRLFPLAYRRLLGGSVSSVSEECVRGAWKDSGAFGPYPKLMMTRLSRSLLATRVFLQALNLGIEVVNTTDHLRPSRDCSRALLRLWYCPHCQGMLGPPACRGFCQAVMQGCLGGAAEVQPHWSSYVDGLGKLAGSMRAEKDMEAVVLRLPSMIRLALKHAVNSRSLNSLTQCWFLIFSSLLCTLQVSGMCGHTPQRASRSVRSPPPHHKVFSLSVSLTFPFFTFLREFISNLRGFSFFYSGLGEALCSREPAPANHSLCWNGQEMTDSSESRSNKPPEPIISQIIDKLKHINQVTRSRGGGGVDGWSDEGEEGFESGDCDDEDECTGVSGLGPPLRRNLVCFLAELDGPLLCAVPHHAQQEPCEWTCCYAPALRRLVTVSTLEESCFFFLSKLMSVLSSPGVSKNTK